MCLRSPRIIIYLFVTRWVSVGCGSSRQPGPPMCQDTLLSVCLFAGDPQFESCWGTCAEHVSECDR
jgi:hypothetical protein